MSHEWSSSPNYKLQKKLMRRRAVRESWPLLIWLGVAALAAWAYQTGGDFQRMRGIVSKPVETISAPFDGRLVPVPVDDRDLQISRDTNGQPKPMEQGVYLNKGDVVAKMDDTLLALQIQAERETAQFDRARLQQQLQQQIIDLRDRVFQLENQEQTLWDQIDNQEELRKRVAAEVRAGSKLASDLEEVEKDINDLRAELSGVTRNLEQTRPLVETAIEGLNRFLTEQGMDPSTPPTGESASIQLLEAQRRQAVIATTSAGFIDKVYARPGSVLRAGDPIMDVVVKAPKTITALIPEENALTLEQGDTVYIAIPNSRKEFVTATVVSLQQSLTQLPDYASPIRGRMVRGRMVEFGELGANDEDSQLPLLPGSEVVITLEEPGRIPFLSWFTE